jgi:hypothetical protein
MTQDEREKEIALKGEAKKKQEDDKSGNFLYLVRGHPWERRIVKIKIHINQKKEEAELISFVFNIYVENQNASKIRYKYDKADFESMRDILNIDWRTILLNKDIDVPWTVFVSKLNDAIDKCVPKVKINSNTDIKSDKNCPLTRKARAKIKKKQRLWNRLRTNPFDSIRKEYNTVRNQVRRISRKRDEFSRKW